MAGTACTNLVGGDRPVLAEELIYERDVDRGLRRHHRQRSDNLLELLYRARACSHAAVGDKPGWLVTPFVVKKSIAFLSAGG
jgi:hypothetical protein